MSDVTLPDFSGLPEPDEDDITPLSGRALDVALSELIGQNLGSPRSREIMQQFLPERARYRSVLERIDLRPLLGQVIREIEAGGLNEPRKLGNDARKLRDARQSLTDQYEETIREVYRSQGLLGTELGQAVQAAIVEPTNITMSPIATLGEAMAGTADVEDSDSPFADSFGDVFDGPMMAGPQQQFNFLTPADVMWRFRMGQSDAAAIGQVMDDVGNRQYAASIGQLPDDVPPETRVEWGDNPYEAGQMLGPTVAALEQTGGAFGDPVKELEVQRQIANLQARRQGQRSYTFTETANLIYNLKPDQLEGLQEQMQAAGYYETSDSNDGLGIRGSATDPGTQAAWRALYSDAIRTRTGIIELLDQRTSQINSQRAQQQQQERDQLRQQELLPDRQEVRWQLRSFGQEIMGRRLRGDEEEAMVEFVNNLHRNANMQGLLIEQGREGSFEDIDMDAQIGEEMRRRYPEESMRMSALETLGHINSRIKGWQG